MSDTLKVVGFEVKTIADLKAMEALKKSLVEINKEQKRLKQDTSETEAAIKKATAALDSESASAIRLAHATQQAEKATRGFASAQTKSAEESAKAILAAQAVQGRALMDVLMRGKAPGTGGSAGGLGAEIGAGVTDALPASLTRLATVAGATAIAIGSLVKGISEFAEKETAILALDMALTKAGLATGSYREHLHNLSTEMEDATGIAEEQWLASLTTLTQYGANGENMDQLAESVKNLAGLMGGDATQATHIISLAMAGYTHALARYGIIVAEGATKTEKLQAIMQQAAERGGGMMEARMAGVSGAIIRAKDAASDAVRVIGSWGATWLQSSGLLRLVTEGLKALQQSLEETYEQLDFSNSAIATHVRSLAEVEAAQQAFKDAQDDIKEKAEAATKALEKETSAIDRMAQAQLELMSATLAADMAESKARQERAKDDPEKVIAEIRLRAKLTEDHEKQAVAVRVKAAQDKVKATESAIRAADEETIRIKTGLAEAQRQQDKVKEWAKAREDLAKARKESPYAKAQAELGGFAAGADQVGAFDMAQGWARDAVPFVTPDGKKQWIRRDEAWKRIAAAKAAEKTGREDFLSDSESSGPIGKLAARERALRERAGGGSLSDSQQAIGEWTMLLKAHEEKTKTDLEKWREEIKRNGELIANENAKLQQRLRETSAEAGSEESRTREQREEKLRNAGKSYQKRLSDWTEKNGEGAMPLPTDDEAEGVRLLESVGKTTAAVNGATQQIVDALAELQGAAESMGLAVATRLADVSATLAGVNSRVTDNMNA